MFNNLTIKNFRSFALEQNIPIKPITLIYGANSSGKSSILKTLLLMKQTLENPSNETSLITKGQYADVGNFKDFINNQDVNKKYSIKFEFDTTTYKNLKLFNHRYTRFKNLNTISIEYIYKNSINKESILNNINLFINKEANPLLSLEISSQDPKLQEHSLINYKTITSIKNRNIKFNYYKVINFNYDSSYFKDFWKSFLDKNKKEKYLEKANNKIKELQHRKRKNNNPKDIFGNTINNFDKVIDAYKKVANFLSQDQEIMLESYKTAIRDHYNKSFMVFSNISFFDENYLETEEDNQDYYNSIFFKSLMFRHYYYDDIDFHLDINHEINSILYEICNFLQISFKNMKYLGALRDNPERYYITTPREKQYVGKSGKNTIDIIAKNKILKNKINKQLKVLDLGYSITPRKITNEDIYLFLLKEEQSGITVSLNDVGFGVSQILPILVQSMLSENETILIEQPEIHIHPKLQAELGSLFAECIKAPNNNKFIIETHSENIILRLQKLIRQKKLNSEDVSVIYVDKSERGSICSRLRMDEKGYFIDKWPNGFFEESFEEIFD